MLDLSSNGESWHLVTLGGPLPVLWACRPALCGWEEEREERSERGQHGRKWEAHRGTISSPPAGRAESQASLPRIREGATLYHIAECHTRGRPGHASNFHPQPEVVGCSTKAGAERGFLKVKNNDLHKNIHAVGTEPSEEFIPLEGAHQA